MLKLTIYSLRTFSVIFFIYFLAVAYYSGIKSSFLWFYITFSISSMILSFILPLIYRSHLKPLLLSARIFMMLMWAVIALFLFVQIRIITFAGTAPPDNADYLIILGAQVRGTAPSLSLLNRINSAYQYLKDNQGTKVICSGGQGRDEDITEAYAINKELIQLGINSDRILLEENSTNTTENLLYCSELMNKETDTVIVVSNSFHIYRACRIAEKIGIKNVYGYSRQDFLLTTPGYYIREFFAICKDFLFGNM